MTKHSDSPELTRLSGEQAEERTAREGRAEEWLSRQHRTFGGHEVVCEHDGDVSPAMSVAELLAAYVESECSRLASRVELLEGALLSIRGWAMNPGEANGYLVIKEIAERVLAGAHAEEK